MSSEDNIKRAGKVLIGGAVGVAAVPAAISAAGFGVGGVAAGSVAAGVQSAVYGASTTGVFSMAQSAGVLGASAVTKAATGTITAAWTYFKS